MTDIAKYRARPDRCVHEWRIVSENSVRVERCARCDVLRSPRLHPAGTRPETPPVFHRLIGALQ